MSDSSKIASLTAPIPQYSVTIWETIAIAASAMLLTLIGLAGLVYKFFSNAADPQRAILIAQSLVEYQLPGGAQGIFGANLGGAKVAIVASSAFPKGDLTLLSADQVAQAAGVELFVARVPLDVDTATGDQTNSKLPPAPKKEAESYELFSSPDFSFSYRSGEEFQVQTDRTDNLGFCGSQVPVRIQTGNFVMNPQFAPVPAVKYDAIANFNDSKRQVTLFAIGRDAATTAATTFQSLTCK